MASAAVTAPARLRANILSLAVLQCMNYAVPLVTVPYLVRVLGATHFGLLSFAQAVVLYFDLLADYGFNLSATRTVARRRDDPVLLWQTFWHTLYAKAALMIAGALFLGTSVALLRADFPLYAATFLTVVGTATLPVWFFQGLEQMRCLTIAQSSARLLTIPALVLLVRAPEHYARAAAIQGAVPVLASVLLVPALARRLPHWPERPRAAEILRVLREGWSAFIAVASLAVNAMTTTVVLGLVAGHTEVGYYSAADRVVRAIAALLNPVTQALYARLNSLNSRSRRLALVLMRKSFGLIGVTAALASLATFCLAGPASAVLLGQRFQHSAAILRCLAPLPLLLALINIMGTQTMLVFGLDAVLARLALIGVLVNIVVTAALAATLGGTGAALAAVASAGLIAAGLAWNVRHVRL